MAQWMFIVLAWSVFLAFASFQTGWLRAQGYFEAHEMGMSDARYPGKIILQSGNRAYILLGGYDVMPISRLKLLAN